MAEGCNIQMNDAPEQDLAVFTEALQLPPSERTAYLEHVCGADLDLRSRVEALLRAYDRSGDFLNEPAAKVPLEAAKELSVGEGPGDRIGRYKLLQQIGEGGCGVVFMAEQEEPVRRKVALKIIKPGMDTKSVIARFEAERQALALMDHPNIAKVFDAGATASGRPYFVMELVRGMRITEYCDQNALTMEERLKLFVQVCQAVQHAHQKGIIHRDIKPSNILVTQSVEGAPVPVVIDFGVAKATTNQLLTDKTLFTAFEMLIGTPAYMSPEQAAFTSADVDTRTDIYSLGVLLYELLTGSTPFDTTALLKSGLDEIRRVIREEEPARPSTRLYKMSRVDLTTVALHRRSEPLRLIRGVSGDLDWIVMKSMEKDRNRRYETANGLALDVNRFLGNEMVSARPPSAVYKFHKAMDRHRFLFFSIGAIALLLVLSLVVVSASLARERKAKTNALNAAAKSEQVTKFLKEMLQSVGPSVALEQDTAMLRAILDRTAQRLGNELTNQPTVEADLQSLIGRVYYELGNYDQAEKMQRDALGLFSAIFGSESKEAVTPLNDLGLTLWRKGSQAEAEAADREALMIGRKLIGEESAEVATSLNQLADVYRHGGKPVEAESLAQQALAIRQKLFGKSSLQAAESLRVLSILFGDEGKWPQSEATAREVLEIRRKRLGAENPLTSVSLVDVAWAASHQNKLAEVEILQREALTIKRKLLPEGHPSTTECLRNLCNTLEQEGKYTEAESLRRESLQLSTRKAGSEAPETLDAIEALARILVARREFSEAERLLNRALTPAVVEQPSSENLLTLRVDLLARRGKWQEAVTNAALAYEHKPSDSGLYAMVAALYLKAGQRAAYERLCDVLLKSFAETTNVFIADQVAKACLFVPRVDLDLHAVARLADLAASNGTADKVAMPFFQDCKAISEYRQGHYSEAVEWAKKPLEIPGNYVHGHVYAVLAMAYWQLEDRQEAQAMLAKGEILAPSVMPASIAEDPSNAWLAWLFARIQLDEATALLHGAKSGDATAN